VPTTEADNEPISIARQLLGEARPGEQVEVCVDRVRRVEVRVHDAAVESYTASKSFGVGVRVVVDGREGTSGCGGFAPEMVSGLLSEARDNASFASVDERAGIACPDGHRAIASTHTANEIEEFSADQRIEMALDVERRVRELDRRVRGVRASVYGDHTITRAVVSTTGIDATSRFGRAALSTSVLIDDIDGGTRTGFAAATGFGPSELSAGEVAGLAVGRGLRLLGAVPATSGRMPVVFPSRIAAALMGIVGSMLSGERVVKGRTPFGGRMGEAIAAPSATLFDDPTDQCSIAVSSIDGEGLACRRVSLIDSGSLVGYLHDSRSARGLGVAGTGSAIRSARATPAPGFRSLHMDAGTHGHDALISEISDGLLVLSLQGLHSGVNQVSGDFSAGVEGIRIRNGSLAEPVKEATLAGSIPRMMLDIAAVGSDLEYLPGGSVIPTLVIDGMSIGGRSTD